MITGDELTMKFPSEIEQRLQAYDRNEGKIALDGCDITPGMMSAVVERLLEFTGLHTLNISHNHLVNAGVEAIARLTGLHTLDISGNQLTESGARVVAGFTGLQTLCISGSSLTDRGAREIAGIFGLRTLNIGHNQLTDAGAEAIAALSGLHTLLIYGNYLTAFGATAIARLVELHTLNISSNRLGDDGAKIIARLTGVHTLYISNNQLTNAGAGAVANLTGLHTLRIRGNTITSPRAILDICDRILKREKTPNDGSIQFKPQIDIRDNPLRWPEMPEDISETILRESDPEKLKALLESLRDNGSARMNVAVVAMAGLTTHGKTHLSRWIVADKSQYQALREPIDPNRHTWGYDRYATILPATAHGQADGLDLSLTIVDVGGHREQLSAINNLIYSNLRRSIFVLCVHAQKDFIRGNFGEYYLKLIQSLAVNRESHEQGHRIFINELVERGERIPVIIVITHASRAGEIRLDEQALRGKFKLLDVVVFDPWDISIGSECVGSA
jgi:hypothetical protein